MSLRGSGSTIDVSAPIPETPAARHASATTALYDVISAEPGFAAGSVPRQQMKLAMAVGDRRNYRLTDIMPRHFIQTARRVKVSRKRMIDLLDRVTADWDAAFGRASDAMPEGFPESIIAAIGTASSMRCNRIGLEHHADSKSA